MDTEDKADSGYRETVDIQCATGAEHFRENLLENFAKTILKMVEISRK